MPSGQTHDRLTIQTTSLVLSTSLVASLQSPSLAAIYSALATTAIASVATYISGIWLSPDVDSMGYLKRRYGALRLLWMPYYKLCRMGGNYKVRGVGTHRSHLSHTPIIGSVSRAVYVCLPLLVLGVAAGVIEPGAIVHLLQAQPRALLAGAIGLEVGSLVHIISDWILSEMR